jgi:hypothetical protein
MNAPPAAAARQRRPCHLCPVCLRKLWALHDATAGGGGGGIGGGGIGGGGIGGGGIGGLDVVSRYKQLARWYTAAGFADEACWAAERVVAITLEHWEVAPELDSAPAAAAAGYHEAGYDAGDEAAPGWAGVGGGGSGFGEGVASVAAGRGPSPGAPAPAPATPEWSLRTGPRDRHPPGPGLRPGLPTGSRRSPGPAPSPGPAADAQVVYAMGERYSVIICHGKRKVNCHGRAGAEAVPVAKPPALSGAACTRALARWHVPVYTLCLRVSHHGATWQSPKRLALPWHAMVCVLWYGNGLTTIEYND